MSYPKAPFKAPGESLSKLLTVSVFLATIFLSLNTIASAAVSSPEIERQVASAIQQAYQSRVPDSRVEVTVNPVNSSLHLNNCTQPLVVDIPFQNGERVTAKATCAAPKRWSVYVTAQVRQYVTVVIARRPIAKDSRLTASALTLGEKNVAREKGKYYTHIQDVVGLTSRSNFGRGQIISPDRVETSTQVHRGDRVTLEVVKGSLHIQTSGTALESGKLDEQIDVRNNHSKRKVRGTIVAPGIVRIQ